MNTVKNIRTEFIKKLHDEDFVIDKSGAKTIEIIGSSFIVDEETIFGELNEEYAKKELAWYISESLNVYDMPKAPAIWKQIADKDGYINSNYGWCIFSDENKNQFQSVVREFRKNKDTRRGTMIYTRPSMQTDYNKNGMSDFMCTNAVNYYIRDDRLNAVVQMRSNDAVFGFKNDAYWQMFVMDLLVTDLQSDYPELQKGDLIWNAGSLHVYERHFHLVN